MQIFIRFFFFNFFLNFKNFKVENETLLKTTQKRTRRNIKSRLNELEEKLNNNDTNIAETKLISPRQGVSDEEKLAQDSARSNKKLIDEEGDKRLKPRIRSGENVKTSHTSVRGTEGNEGHVNEAYESDHNTKTQNEEENTEEKVDKPKKRARKAKKKVETNLEGTLFCSYIFRLVKK